MAEQVNEFRLPLNTHDVTRIKPGDFVIGSGYRGVVERVDIKMGPRGVRDWNIEFSPMHQGMKSAIGQVQSGDGG